jgi:predicted small secreted protein
MRRSIALASLALFLIAGAATLSGCNTMRGLGQDTSAAGRALSNSAEEVKEKF